MLCSLLTMAVASFAHFLFCCQKPHADSGHGQGRRNEGRAPNKGRPRPPHGRPSSRTWPVQRRDQRKGPLRARTSGTCLRAAGCLCSSCLWRPQLHAPAWRRCAHSTRTSTRRLFPGPTVEASVCNCFWMGAVTRPPPAPAVVEPGSGQRRAAGSGHPRPVVGSRKEFHASKTPLPQAQCHGLKAWLMGFLVLTNSSGQNSVSLMVSLLCFSCSK